MRKCLLFLGLALLLASVLLSCQTGDAVRYLVVTETTHFAIRGSGASLNLPVFVGTLGTDQVLRDVSQAEHYYQKLSAVYGQKSFTFLADSTVELLTERAGDLKLAQPVYSYEEPRGKITLALLSFKNNTASYLFRVTDPQTGQVRDHTVEIPVGQSASVGLLFDPENNRGHLVAISVKALAITPSLTPDNLAAFLREKNAPQKSDSVLYKPADQKWMDELFGARAIKLPVAHENAQPFDAAPAPVGGSIAFSEHMVYPASAIRDSLEGRVMVDALIGENGDVVACKVIKGVRSDLDSAAVNAVRPVKFTPAQYQGKPVRVHIAIPFAFKLSK